MDTNKNKKKSNYIYNIIRPKEKSSRQKFRAKRDSNNNRPSGKEFIGDNRSFYDSYWRCAKSLR